MKTTRCIVLIALLLVPASVRGAEADGEDFEGSVEITHRTVDVDGSLAKYDEDFDALKSGAFLSHLSADWFTSESTLLDYAKLELDDIGSQPHERAWFKAGRRNAYELEIDYTKQDSVYNLFGLVGDLDGHQWNAERRHADVDLTLHPSDKVRVFLEFRQGERRGSSVFMKDVNQDIFLLDTPLDSTVRHYGLGAAFRVGDADIVLRQTTRRYDNVFVNSTTNNPGLEPTRPATLDAYRWDQRESSTEDWTSIKVSSPIGDRVRVTLSVLGTFLGNEKLDSSVRLDATGTAANGVDPYSVVGGSNDTRLEGETTLFDFDVNVRLTQALDLQVQYRSLNRKLEGEAVEDLEATGTANDVATVNDYEITTTTALLDYRPRRELGLRGGVRWIDRELFRTGYVGLRNLDYRSGDDETIILGLVLRPVDWFRLNADHEDGDIHQPFNAVAPQEREHTRIRAVFIPQSDMRVDVSYLHYRHTNSARDIRDIFPPQGRWDSRLEGNTWSASLWHRANENVDYMFRYAVQDVDHAVGMTFDTAAFGGNEDGDSLFDRDNEQFSAQVNFRWDGPWKASLRYWHAKSDGSDLLLGDLSGVVGGPIIEQDFSNAEIDVTYNFERGVFVGGSYRDFDYDDANDRLDYDGGIFAFRLGTRF